jgi:hypothetical protein
VLATVAAACGASGCGEQESLPSACVQATADDVRQVLAAAPQRAALADGTRLSECVDRAEDDGALQTLGITFVAVADELSAQVGDGDAAFRLGFLIGAAERGAGPTGGLQGELVHRLQQTVAFRVDDPSVRREVLRGIAAGRRAG